MTRPSHSLPPWADSDSANALFDPDSLPTLEFDAICLAGKLLRARSSSTKLVTSVREHLVRHSSHFQASGIEPWAVQTVSEARDIAERLESTKSTLESAKEGEAGRIYSLALLRDDLEALRHALAAVFVSLRNEKTELLQNLKHSADHLAELARDLDEDLEPFADRFRDRLLELGEPVPAELLDMVSNGPNPWWLQIVEPAPAKQQVAIKLAASSTRQLRFEGGISFDIIAEGKGKVKLLLRASNEITLPLTLVWIEDGELKEIQLIEEVKDVPVAIVSDSILSNTSLVLRGATQSWGLAD